MRKDRRLHAGGLRGGWPDNVPASRRSLVLALAAVLFVPVTTGCLLGEDAPDRVEEWRNARQAHEPFGQPAEDVRLVGSPLEVTGELAPVDVSPTRLSPKEVFSADEPLLYVDGTTLADGRTGLVVVQGEQLTVEDGTLQGVPVERVNASGGVTLTSPVDQGPGQPTVEEVPGWEAADDGLFFAEEWSATPDGLLVDNLTRAALVSEGETEELSGPIHLDGGQIYADEQVVIETAELTTRADRFRVAGDVTQGHAGIQGGPSAQAPDVVAGSAEQVTIRPGSFQASGELHITQILDGDTPLVDAELELYADEDHVRLSEEPEELVPIWYREHGYEGDALVQDVEVEGAPEGLATVPLEEPSLLDELGLTVPAALLVAPAMPFLALAESFSDLFEEDPTPLPAWIDAGEVSSFSLVLDASDVEPGTYDVEITLSGNFPDASTEVQVEVDPPDTVAEDPAAR